MIIIFRIRIRKEQDIASLLAKLLLADCAIYKKKSYNYYISLSIIKNTNSQNLLTKLIAKLDC